MTDHSPTDLTNPSYAELLAKIALLEQQQKQQQDAYQQRLQEQQQQYEKQLKAYQVQIEHLIEKQKLLIHQLFGQKEIVINTKHWEKNEYRIDIINDFNTYTGTFNIN
jgi:hypothetical protein